MKYCVVGLGPAGAQAVVAIHRHDPQADVTLVADEPWPHYYRAALSDYLLGHITREQLWAFPDGYFEGFSVRRIEARVTEVDRTARQLFTDDGQALDYDRLLLAGGSGSGPLSCSGSNLSGVLGLHTLADADRLQPMLQSGGRAVVIGAGRRGLTLAYLARRRGMEVTLLVPEGALGAPWLDARASQLLYRRVVEDGVDIRLGEGVAVIEGAQGRVAAVRTSANKGIACAWVGVGLSGPPRHVGLPGTDVGMPVDERMQTLHAGIFAAGDGCRVWDQALERHREIGGWQAAMLQGRVAGANMAGGSEVYSPGHCYRATMLYDLPLTLIGRVGERGDAEVASSPNADGYRHLAFQDGRLIAATLLGNRRHANIIQRVVELGVDVRGHELQLLRTDIDLNHLLRTTGEYHLY